MIKIIAEIGNTHEGSVGLAKQFIKSAANCGVDAVKFQTHIFEAESLPLAPNPPYFKGETRKEYFERTAFNIVQYRTLKKYAEEECGVEFLSSAFSIEAVDLLVELGVKTIKIPSGEVNNIPLLHHIAKVTNASILLSSGMSSWAELDEAVTILKKQNPLIILQCTSEYPCLPENAGLNIMTELQDRYHCPVGFSDHTIGIGIPIAAVVLGATVIEKHFTLSKLMYGSDAVNSTEPIEFTQLVNEIRAVKKALVNKIDKDVKVNELRGMKGIFEKSIVAKHGLLNGHRIRVDDLAFKKPNMGIPAAKYLDLLGKILIKDVNVDHVFQWEDFK
jgi:N,N'-diacetyllegionaminate synthase